MEQAIESEEFGPYAGLDLVKKVFDNKIARMIRNMSISI
jgi:hypothetical protein